MDVRDLNRWRRLPSGLVSTVRSSSVGSIAMVLEAVRVAGVSK